MYSPAGFITVLILVTVAASEVPRNCLNCLCEVESNCKKVPCKPDGGSDSCGWYQIKKAYYIDCGQPEKQKGESTDKAWRRCALKKSCAEKCVQGYMKRYAKSCGTPSCEVYARVHNGGPRGCRSSSTLPYWRKVQQCLKSG